MTGPAAPDGGVAGSVGADTRAWPRVLPFALWVGLMVADPLLAGWVEGVFDPRWLYAVRSVATGAVLLLLWGRYRELRPPSAAGAGAWGLAVAVGVAVCVLWVLLDVPVLALAGGEGFDPRVAGRIDVGLAAARLAGSALVVPVMEELFWRSFVMRWVQHPRFAGVDPRTVGWKAVLVSSVVFGMEHRLWFAGILAGLAYAWLYRRTGDLRVAVLSHAVTNALLGVYVLATASWRFW